MQISAQPQAELESSRLSEPAFKHSGDMLLHSNWKLNNNRALSPPDHNLSMQPQLLLAVMSMFAVPALGDWTLWAGTCVGGWGGVSESPWNQDTAAWGSPCGKYLGSWDSTQAMAPRMDSANPCNSGGTKFRYVRDGSNYGIYWNGDPNKRLGTCYLRAGEGIHNSCQTWNAACTMLLMYDCKSSACQKME